MKREVFVLSLILLSLFIISSVKAIPDRYATCGVDFLAPCPCGTNDLYSQGCPSGMKCYSITSGGTPNFMLCSYANSWLHDLNCYDCDMRQETCESCCDATGGNCNACNSLLYNSVNWWVPFPDNRYCAGQCNTEPGDECGSGLCNDFCCGDDPNEEYAYFAEFTYDGDGDPISYTARASAEACDLNECTTLLEEGIYYPGIPHRAELSQACCLDETDCVYVRCMGMDENSCDYSAYQQAAGCIASGDSQIIDTTKVDSSDSEYKYTTGYCDSGTWKDPDEDQNYCDPIFNNEWLKSGEGGSFGEYTFEGEFGCCGDDVEFTAISTIFEKDRTCWVDSLGANGASCGSAGTVCCKREGGVNKCVGNDEHCYDSDSCYGYGTMNNAYCWGGGWYDPDTDEDYCGQICDLTSGWHEPGTGIMWNAGAGEVSQNTCCGDDPNEYYNAFRCVHNPESTLTCTTDLNDDACCNSYDCVVNGQCISNGTAYDKNSDSKKELYCSADVGSQWIGTWYNTDRNVDNCRAGSGWTYWWNVGVGDADADGGYVRSSGNNVNNCEDGRADWIRSSLSCCCGDDSGEYTTDSRMYQGGIQSCCANSGACAWENLAGSNACNTAGAEGQQVAPGTRRGTCYDSVNNDCDTDPSYGNVEVFDYDTHDRGWGSAAHGDSDCRVDVKSASVDDDNPCPGDLIVLTCEIGTQVAVNSIEGKLIKVGEPEVTCTFNDDWNGVMGDWFGTFNCVVPSGWTGAIQATCSVDTDKSYAKAGYESKSYAVSVRLASDLVCMGSCGAYSTSSACTTAGCYWCVKCNPVEPFKKSNPFGVDKCVDNSAACVYDCHAGVCTADCDGTSGGCSGNGPDVCTADTLQIGGANQCNTGTCICEPDEPDNLYCTEDNVRTTESCGGEPYCCTDMGGGSYEWVAGACPDCTINDYTVTPLCSGGCTTNCNPSEGIDVAVTYVGADCEAVAGTAYVQVDASDGASCSIQHSGGDISGIYGTCLGGSGCTVHYTLPATDFNADCNGKTVTPFVAGIYDSGAYDNLIARIVQDETSFTLENCGGGPGADSCDDYDGNRVACESSADSLNCRWCFHCRYFVPYMNMYNDVGGICIDATEACNMYQVGPWYCKPGDCGANCAVAGDCSGPICDGKKTYPGQDCVNCQCAGTGVSTCVLGNPCGAECTVADLTACAPGDTCSSNCECTGAGPSTCVLTSSWANSDETEIFTANVVDWPKGVRTYLVVEGVDCPDGVISFLISEHDTGQPLDSVTLDIPPVDADFVSNYASSPWFAEWHEDDCGLLPCVDDHPEYKFEATLDTDGSTDLTDYYLKVRDDVIPDPGDSECGDGNLDNGEECEYGTSYDCDFLGPEWQCEPPYGDPDSEDPDYECLCYKPDPNDPGDINLRVYRIPGECTGSGLFGSQPVTYIVRNLLITVPGPDPVASGYYAREPWTQQEDCILSEKIPFFDITNILFVALLLIIIYTFRKRK